jgi:hypothetical protein
VLEAPPPFETPPVPELVDALPPEFLLMPLAVHPQVIVASASNRAPIAEATRRRVSR